MSCYYTKLEQDALLHIEGQDARTFLQGQVTCDMRELSAERALPGLYCTVQGRVVCDFLVSAATQDHLVLRMRQDICSSTAALFAKYIIFSKAKLDALRDDWQVSACWGTDAPAILEDVFGALPRERYGSRVGDGFILVQIDNAGQQFECYLSRDAAELESRVKERTAPGTEADWQAAQIAAGIARIETGTAGEYVPQVLNYDLTGHISFTKGCYTGQEVVARLHYRGKPKRRLYMADIDAKNYPLNAQINPGDSLYTSESPKAVGNVINPARSRDGGQLMLVTATEAGVNTGLRVGDSNGPPLHIGAMPYPLPE